MTVPICALCKRIFSDRKSLHKVRLAGEILRTRTEIEVCKPCLDGLRQVGKRNR
jgi:hypothetical protein